MKLISKERVGGTLVKVHSKAIKPYQRLIDSGVLTTEQNAALKFKGESLNPFDLKKELEKQLKWLFRITEAGKQEAA